MKVEPRAWGVSVKEYMGIAEEEDIWVWLLHPPRDRFWNPMFTLLRVGVAGMSGINKSEPSLVKLDPIENEVETADDGGVKSNGSELYESKEEPNSIELERGDVDRPDVGVKGP